MTVVIDPRAYFDFFHDYFATGMIFGAVVLIASSLLALFLSFRISRSSFVRSKLLVGMLVLSSSFWVFLISSLLFCMSLVQRYWVSPSATISLVAELGFLTALVTGPTAFFLLRARAVKQISDCLFSKMENAQRDDPNERIAAVLSNLASRVGLRGNVRLALLESDSSFPVSAAFELGGTEIVAIRKSVAGMLDDDELEAVLAHELAHIKNRDSLQKTLATTFRMALIFDPLVRLIEAALYREREFAADESAALATRRPASLASALLKMYDALGSKQSLGLPTISAISLSKSSKLLSKQPPLELRVKRLLALAEVI